MDATAQRVGVYIRWIVQRDLREVLAVEDDSFEMPWSEDDFLRCLRQRNCIGMVAEGSKKQVVGYMLYELHEHSLHVLNFAVAPSWRRSGVGRQMVEKLQTKLSSHRRTALTADVRETNLAALLFFRRCGLRAEGLKRGFYTDTDDDAVRMAYRLVEW